MTSFRGETEPHDGHRVGEIMSQPPLTVTVETRVGDAEWLAEDRGVGHLLVVEEGRLAGVVCDSDWEGADPDSPVSCCMSAPAISVDTTLPLTFAAEMMRQRAVGCLPVVEGGRILGIVTQRDLLNAGCTADQVRPECASCQSRAHVRMGPSGVPFCTDCLERAVPPDLDDEIGVGD